MFSGGSSRATLTTFPEFFQTATQHLDGGPLGRIGRLTSTANEDWEALLRVGQKSSSTDALASEPCAFAPPGPSQQQLRYGAC